MHNRKTVFFAGAAVVLIVFIAVSAFYMKTHPKKKQKTESEATTEIMNEEDKDNVMEEESTITRKRENRQKESITVRGIDYLYYLDPDGNQEFQERIASFLNNQGITTQYVEVMEQHIDDRDAAEIPAVFFLKIEGNTQYLIKVSFQKTRGHYSFSICEKGDDLYEDFFESDESVDTGMDDYPETNADTETVRIKVSIKDPEEELKGHADIEELESQLESFLQSKDEGRRNLYVTSVTVTEDGFQTILGFETVRNDGRNIEATYDGAYHFRFV